MLGQHFGRLIHVPGTLAANLDIRFSVPVDCRLVRVSHCAGNDSDATFTLGVSGDTDSILTSTNLGDSGTPTVEDVDDWAATNPTGRLSQGDVLVITLDFDGVAGAAAQDVTMDLDFLEG